MTSATSANMANQPVFQPLTKVLGARVGGVDCRDVDDDLWQLILAAFNRHHLLVFPEQSLSPEQHADFMERFGELDVHPQELSARTTLPLPGHPRVELMENKPGNYGPRASAWHTDVTFRGKPPAVTSLYGVETPVGCADTIWGSMRAVFDSCSPGLQATLRELRAVHATAFVRGASRAGSIDYDPTVESDPRKSVPEATYRDEVAHPVVHGHDAGFDTLYINPAFVSRIEGRDDAESDNLLSFLYRRGTEPNFTYRHAWSKGDLVLWDNRCTMHYGVNDYGEADRRVLHRTTGAPFQVHASRRA